MAILEAIRLRFLSRELSIRLSATIGVIGVERTLRIRELLLHQLEESGMIKAAMESGAASKGGLRKCWSTPPAQIKGMYGTQLII